MSDYQPKPGTHAHAFYAYLLEQPEGYSCTLGGIAEIIGMGTSGGIGPTMKPLIRHGLVLREKRRGGKDPSLYRLGRRIPIEASLRVFKEQRAAEILEEDCQPFVHRIVGATVADLPRLPTIFSIGAGQ